MALERLFYPFARAEKERTFPTLGKSGFNFSKHWKTNHFRIENFSKHWKKSFQGLEAGEPNG